jgi:hypothetical protein
MNKTNKFFVIIAVTVLVVLVLSGCASFLYGVNIRTDGNVTSVLAGRTLVMRASGRNLVWSVGSTRDGSGPVASGTSITQNGLLTVSANETASVLYVPATSTRDGFSQT